MHVFSVDKAIEMFYTHWVIPSVHAVILYHQLSLSLSVYSVVYNGILSIYKRVSSSICGVVTGAKSYVYIQV